MRIAIFTSCLVNTFRPAIGDATLKILESNGFQVDIPDVQTCCGLFPQNSGDHKEARKLEKAALKQLKDYDFVVSPSHACTQHLQNTVKDCCHSSARKYYEITEFLTSFSKPPYGPTEHLQWGPVGVLETSETPTLFGSSSSTKSVLAARPNVNLVNLPDAMPYSPKESKNSQSLSHQMLKSLQNSGAGLIVGTDLGLLMQAAAGLKRLGSAIEIRHVTEVLANTVKTSPL